MTSTTWRRHQLASDAGCRPDRPVRCLPSPQPQAEQRRVRTIPDSSSRRKGWRIQNAVGQPPIPKQAATTVANSRASSTGTGAPVATLSPSTGGCREKLTAGAVISQRIRRRTILWPSHRPTSRSVRSTRHPAGRHPLPDPSSRCLTGHQAACRRTPRTLANGTTAPDQQLARCHHPSPADRN